MDKEKKSRGYNLLNVYTQIRRMISLQYLLLSYCSVLINVLLEYSVPGNQIQFCTYGNTVVMVKRAGGEFVRVLVLVRWEQFTQQFSVDIRKCSKVIRKT